MPTPESSSVPLTLLLQSCSRRIMEGVLARLAPHFAEINAAHLTLFGALDCGATHASDVAARLGISRQAVARTARELAALGYLRLDEDPMQRNRQHLTLTEAGVQLALAGRAALAEVETELAARIGEPALAALRAGLLAAWQPRLPPAEITTPFRQVAKVSTAPEAGACLVLRTGAE